MTRVLVNIINSDFITVEDDKLPLLVEEENHKNVLGDGLLLDKWGDI